jgi:cytochrome b
MNPAPAAPAAAVKVWGPAVRLAHGVLAACVALCLYWYEGGAWHERLGYLVLAVSAWRLLVGCIGRPAHLRFKAFVHGPRVTWAYARAWLHGREARHLGHNPLGGWMIVALLAMALLAGASGALHATTWFWGEPLLYAVHRLSGWAFAALVPVHVAGVLLASWRHRENLVGAMLHGHKPRPQLGDVPLV